MVMPGDNVTMTIELITPIAMEEKLRFAIREGGRTVGAGVVTTHHRIGKRGREPRTDCRGWPSDALCKTAEKATDSEVARPPTPKALNLSRKKCDKPVELGYVSAPARSAEAQGV